jgi:hypothetical protein
MYSRNLVLDEATENALKSHLDDIILRHEAERSVWMSDLNRYQKDYWAEPAKDPARRPWKGAAQVIIPLSAITSEAVHARIMTRLYGLNQFVSVKAKVNEFSDFAPKFENAMNDILMGETRFRDKTESALLELTKFGTGVAKSGYERIVKYVCQTNEVGQEEIVPVVVRDGGCVDTVPLSRFLMPFDEFDPQLARWCGEELVYTPYQFKVNETGGLFVQGSYDKIQSYFQNLIDSNKFQTTQENIEHRAPALPERLKIYEIWLAYDVASEDQREQKEIVLHYHKDSRTFCSIRYNPYYDGRRPYRIGQYFKVEHRWTGVGVAKQVEQFQREVTAQHRMRLDNAALANMRMIKVHRMSGYGPDEEIYPGKMWFLQDMEHMDTFQLGEVYPSSFNDESLTLSYAQQRSGINDLMLGMPSSGTPDTATGSLRRVEEGTKRFDYTYHNVKTFVNDLILDLACNIQQFGSKKLSYIGETPDGQAVKMMLSMPKEYLREAIILDIKAAGETDNNIVDRQNWTQVSGMLQQYYAGLIQIAQMSQNPQMMQLISAKAMVASTEAMKQILESYDVRNVERMIFSEVLKNELPQGGVAPAQIPGAIPGNGNGVSINGGAPANAAAGMGNISPDVLQAIAARGGIGL